MVVRKWMEMETTFFLSKRLMFKGIRCYFLGNVRVFGKQNPQMTWTCFHWNPDWFRFCWSLFPLRNNPGIKQGRISSPKKHKLHKLIWSQRFDRLLLSCSSEMDVEFLIYLNLPDTTQVSILKKNYKTCSGWMRVIEGSWVPILTLHRFIPS